MKRPAKSAEVRKQATDDPGKLRIEFAAEVLRRIRQHARSSMSAEICGVLIGEFSGESTIVEASIPGEDARQGGSHVTFTQDTWTHIYQVKDSQYPEKRIVGWYHSHPGFGVFLSEHDTFIHKNFFSNANQVAWVFDPHSDEEGCFAWQKGEIARITEIAVRDRPGSVHSNRTEVEPDHPAQQLSASPEEELADAGPEGRTTHSRVKRWIGLTLSHLLAIILGFVIGFLLVPVVVIPDSGPPRPDIAAPAQRGDQSK